MFRTSSSEKFLSYSFLSEKVTISQIFLKILKIYLVFWKPILQQKILRALLYRKLQVFIEKVLRFFVNRGLLLFNLNFLDENR